MQDYGSPGLTLPTPGLGRANVSTLQSGAGRQEAQGGSRLLGGASEEGVKGLSEASGDGAEELGNLGRGGGNGGWAGFLYTLGTLGWVEPAVRLQSWARPGQKHTLSVCAG